MPPVAALRLLESLDEFVDWLSLSDADETRIIKSAPRRGLQGRILFDALIGECALLAGCPTVVTANPTHLRHVLPQADIVDLTLRAYS